MVITNLIFLYKIRTGSIGYESEILLNTQPTIISELQALRASIGKKLSPEIIRDSNFDFVSQYTHPEYYLAKCFPCLFPYGRGCPTDVNSKIKSIGYHCKLMLSRGGGPHGRAFQNSTNYIFTMYSLEMKRRIGGVAWTTQRKNISESSINEVDSEPIVAEIETLLSYLENNNVLENVIDREGGSPDVERLSRDEIIQDQMEKLMKRLIPYSKYLQGTPMQILHEKAKLMALLPSPIVAKDGTWRWFSTLAPADVFENRLFEILAEVSENDGYDWKEREKTALKLSHAERIVLLRSHPALAARLFHLKQHCIWNCILLGENKPLGQIVDFWRRIEVFYCQCDFFMYDFDANLCA
jgi:hypothetical protein